MKRILNSLLFRIAALLFFGLAALQAAILLAVMWPDGRPMMLRLVDPVDARQMAEAVEKAPAALRPMIVTAASHGGIRVELLPGFPDEPLAGEYLRPAPRLEARFARYAEELGDRSIRVQAREGGLLARGGSADEPPRGPMRVLVGLDTGEVLAIERAPVVLQLLASRYAAVALVAVGVVLLLMLMLLWQVVRPIARLAHATHAFGEDVAAPDAPVSGAREVRALAEGFNAMKQRISGLVSERTRMLAAIAHDQRTYLTRLRLRADHIGDARQRDRAVADIEEMGRLLDDILLFARAEAVADPAAAPIDAVTEALDYVELRKETGDDVAVAVGADALPCCCGRLAFRRILANLVDNAVRYGTRARIILKEDSGDVVMTVTDDGPGVPPARIESLTAPFERVEESRGRACGGAGLGLTIVEALVKSHGGRLIIENRETRGLRVIVRLPGAP
jgi:two-component system, OmpR family, osmolarity sensor histidine kinase EnvZ